MKMDICTYSNQIRHVKIKIYLKNKKYDYSLWTGSFVDFMDFSFLSYPTMRLEV